MRPLVLLLLLTPSAAQAKTMTVDALVAGLEKQIQTIEDSGALRAEFAAFARQHRLATDAKARSDYVRVRTIFEATRDGGWWNLRWTITHREPRSDAIWQQWSKQKGPSDAESAAPSAEAECDELSTLFAFLVRRLGVRHVGLFWPTGNHTVAVWSARGADGKPVRIVVPTSQIYLSSQASLGTDEFDPKRQRTIYDYDRRDVRGGWRIPAALGESFIAAVGQFGTLSSAKLQARRNRRSQVLDGS